MSERKKKPNPGYVSLELCNQRHETLLEKLEVFQKQVDIVRKALVGDDLRGGLVKDVQEMRGERVLSGKDKAAIIVAVLSAVTAVIVALVK